MNMYSPVKTLKGSNSRRLGQNGFLVSKNSYISPHWEVYELSKASTFRSRLPIEKSYIPH
jgi:hypothetical protein